MVNDIIDSIARVLKREYEHMCIYSEEVEQGFKLPCFTIKCDKIHNELFRGKRYRSVNTISINYYSDKEDKNEDYNIVMTNLFNKLQYIEYSLGKIAGTNMEMVKEKDYCSFKFDITFFYFMEDYYEQMSKLKQEINVQKSK